MISAARLARDLLACDATDWQAHNVLGAIAFYDQRYDKAVERFENALKHGIELPGLVANLADALVEYGLRSTPDLRKERLRRAIGLYSSIDDGSQFTSYKLARTRLLIGEPLIALTHIATVPDKYDFEASRGKARILQGAIYLQISKNGTEFAKVENIKSAEDQFVKGFRMDRTFWRNVFSKNVSNEKEPFEEIVTIYDDWWLRWADKAGL